MIHLAGKHSSQACQKLSENWLFQCPQLLELRLSDSKQGDMLSDKVLLKTTTVM